MLEVYIDGLAADMQQKLAPYGGIRVYSGMDLDQFAQLLGSSKAQAPCVLLVAMCSNASQPSYQALSPNNQWIQKPFDINTFPLMLGISARIFAPDPQSAMNLANLIYNLYSRGISLGYQHPFFPQERIVVPYFSSPVTGAPSFIQSAGIYVLEFPVRNPEPPVPCFFNPNSFQLIGKNVFAEMELLSIAAICAANSSFYVDNMMQAKYRYLASPQKLGRKESGKVSGSLKAMRKSYQSGTQIDPNAFFQEFSDLICLIPDLYQRAMMHEPYEATFSIYQNNFSQYRARRDWICDQLRIPPHLELHIDETSQPREPLGLMTMLNTMVENEGMHVESAFNQYYEAVSAQSAQIDQVTDFVTGLANNYMENKIGGLDLGNSQITGVAQDFLRGKFMK